MVHKRYIKRGNRTYGPYFYKSVRDTNGKVRNVYLGQKPPNIELWKILGIFFIAFCLFLIAFQEMNITGASVVTLHKNDESQELGSILLKSSGDYKFSVSEEGNRLDVFGIKNPPKNINLEFNEPKSKIMKSDVVYLDEFDVGFAEIELKKSGHIEAIFYCENYDRINKNCLNWEKTDIPFEVDGDVVRFTVNHFTAYAAGSYTNLTIWDDTDSGTKYSNCSETCIPGKEESDYNINFYANYSNGTIGAITDGCEIKFDFTGIYTDYIAMDYNEEIKLHKYTTSFNRRGEHTFKVKCTNNTYEELEVEDTFFITNTQPYHLLGLDTVAPNQECDEDTTCIYDLSANFSDDDVNDLPLLTYKINNASSEFQDCLTINSNTGEVSVECILSTQAGDHYFTATVTDGLESTSSTIEIPYTIYAVNDAPEITSSLNVECTQDSLCNFYMDVDDEENGSITSGTGDGLGLLSYTDNSSLFDIDAENGSIRFMPINDNVGTHVIQINVTDSNDPSATTSENLILTVIDVNDPPEIIYACDEELVQTEGEFFSCYINTTDIDVDDTHTYFANYSWFNFSCVDVDVIDGQSSCLVNFVPPPESVYNHWINISVEDAGGLKDSTLINFTVNNVPQYPKFVNTTEEFVLYVNASFTLNMSATDDDFYTQFGDELTYYDNTTLFNINSTTGMISLLPNASIVGTYWVNISVVDIYDNWNSTVRNFTIFPNHLPIYDGKFHHVVWDKISFELNLTENTTDPDGDSFTFEDNTTLFDVNETAGIINFTANDSLVGTHWVKINITDEKGATNNYDLNFTVYNINDPPVLDSIENYSIDEGEELYFYVTADDPDLAIPDSTEYLRFRDNSTLFDINPVDGEIRFTPGANTNGTYWINITVNDSSGLEDSQIFLLNISSALFAPRLEYVCDNERNATQDQLFTCIINATDEDGGAVLWFRSNYSFFALNESNITVVDNVATTIVNFTPSREDVGNYSINITVYDNTYLLDSRVIQFNITGVNYPPNLTYIEPQELTVDVPYTYEVNATDPDGDDLTYHDNTTLFDINLTTGVISFTPNSSHVGTHWVNISVNDTYNQFDSQVVNFTVYIGQPPTCTEFLHANEGWFPSPDNFNATENSTIGKFTVTCSDPSDYDFYYNWYINGTLNKSALDAVPYSSTWDYNISFLEAGDVNITLEVINIYDKSTKYYWNVSIADLNAPPMMYSDIPNITWYQDENANLDLTEYFFDYDNDNLSYSWFEYSINETFTNFTNMTVIDSWSNQSGDWGILNLSGEIVYSQLNDSDDFFSLYSLNNYMNITEYKVKLRFLTNGKAGLCIKSQDSCWNGQQIYLDSSNNLIFWSNVSEGVSTQTNDTYNFNVDLDTDYWLKVKHNANNTLVYVSSDDGVYSQAYNITYPSKQESLDIGLFSSEAKVYFDNIILKDPIISNMVVTINQTEENITFVNDEGFVGEVPLYIVASDYNHSRQSNEFYLIVQEVKTSDPIVRTITETSTSTSTSTVIRKPSLSINVPSFVTLTPLAKTIVPVVLNNTGEIDLSIIDLLATTNASELGLLLSESNFDELKVGESVRLELEVTAGILTPDRYTIFLDAFVDDPELHEQAKIIVDVREKQAALQTQLREQIEFVRDLFLQNPECLELNELLEQAQTLYDLKQFEQGLELVKKANAACKNFIAEERKKRAPQSILEAKNFFLENWKAITLELIALIFAIFLVMYYFKRRKFSNSIK